MKRFILLSLCLFVAVGVVLHLSQERAGSAVTGQCANCHTMHDSQDGQPVTQGGPYAFLLKGDCIWCHSEDNITSPTHSQTGAPLVYRLSEPNSQTDTVYGRTGPNSTLAGGDFYWVATSGGATDSKGHNVAGIADQDANIGLTPPGWDPAATQNNSRGQVANGAQSWNTQLGCFGTYGCHGTNSGLGGHHTNVNRAFGDTANTVANSYRFLYGIQGYEDPNWEWTATDTDHNDYKAAAGNQSNYADKSTISYLCAECHGVFHQQTGSGGTYGTGSPWYRHPTDFTLPTGKEYPSGATYVVNVPVGRTSDPGANKNVFSAGVDQVICLSCHRAHGSDFDDLLRFDYSQMIAGGGGAATGKGCFVCHTAKD